MAELSTRTRSILIGTLIGILLVSAYIAYLMVSQPTGGISGAVTSRQTGPQIGGDFTLTDQNGKTITQADFLGKTTAIFFGFTHCPDVCPTTLTDMTDRMAALGAEADKLNVLFVTIDPARDTPALLKTYLESFDSRIQAGTGTQAQIDDMVGKFRVYARKVGEGDSYTMDHSTAVYLFSAKGELVSLLDYHASRDEALEKIRRALAS